MSWQRNQKRKKERTVRKKKQREPVENWTPIATLPPDRREYQVFTSAGRQKVAEFVPAFQGQAEFWLHDLELEEDFQVLGYRDLQPNPTRKELAG